MWPLLLNNRKQYGPSGPDVAEIDSQWPLQAFKERLFMVVRVTLQ